MPLLDQLDDRTLDGRWAYERKKISLNDMVWVEQFVSVKPRQEEFAMAPGSAAVGYGEQGEVRIWGRGSITNLEPEDLAGGMEITYQKKIPPIRDFSFLVNENQNPGQQLQSVFGEQRYLISPEQYFEFLNRGILAKTFYERIRKGSCLCCGSSLYHNQCPKCGA